MYYKDIVSFYFLLSRAKVDSLFSNWAISLLQDSCDPVMTAYKLVTIDAPYWGFGYRLEQALLAVSLLRNCCEENAIVFILFVQVPSYSMRQFEIYKI